MGKLRDQTHNEGFHFKRRPDMLPLEAINRIRVLSERGMGSKAIAKSTGISRNTVRKYLSHFQTLTPISSEEQRPSRLDSFRDQIHEWFLACRGHCPVVLRKIQSELGVSISLRQLQKYCQPWRTSNKQFWLNSQAFALRRSSGEAREDHAEKFLLCTIQRN